MKLSIAPLGFISKLAIWLLLTADLSVLNVLIGVGISVVLPDLSQAFHRGQARTWVMGMWKVIRAIPVAYAEGFEMLFFPHKVNSVVVQDASGFSPATLFLDIFLITFTPKTIVLNYWPNLGKPGQYEVHKLDRSDQ